MVPHVSENGTRAFLHSRISHFYHFTMFPFLLLNHFPIFTTLPYFHFTTTIFYHFSTQPFLSFVPFSVVDHRQDATRRLPVLHLVRDPPRHQAREGEQPGLGF
jgi:hypothetical protein